MRAVSSAQELAAVRSAVGRGELAEAARPGRQAVSQAGAAPEEAVGAESERGEAAARGAHRRQKLRGEVGASLPRATGEGWLHANPFGVHLSETEAKLELDGQRVFRCLLRPCEEDPRASTRESKW